MPNRVEWNPRHSVGDESLDAQHRELLARCNALGDCLAASGPDTDPEADRRFDLAFKELMALARAHFTASTGGIAFAHTRALRRADEARSARWKAFVCCRRRRFQREKRERCGDKSKSGLHAVQPKQGRVRLQAH